MMMACTLRANHKTTVPVCSFDSSTDSFDDLLKRERPGEDAMVCNTKTSAHFEEPNRDLCIQVVSAGAHLPGQLLICVLNESAVRSICAEQRDGDARFCTIRD
jgi:hypothetical protein